MAAIVWNGGDGDWSLASDWSTGAAPTLADDVAISAAGSYIVTISSADVANSLAFGAAQAALYEGVGSLAISGALTIDSGYVSLNQANTIGSVSLGAATLAFGNSGALGAGVVTVNGGQLLATANTTLANALNLAGNVTIAAANGKTLNENASAYTLAAGATLNFGASGEGGTIIWHTGAGSVVPSLGDMTVQAGTLKGADSGFSSIFSHSPQTTVAAGATLDLGGHSATINDLEAAGSVTDSGAAATLTLGRANLSGAVGGSLSLVFNGDASLSGVESMTGGATLNGPITVTNTGTYDIVANAGIAGSSGSAFINDGLVEKTGGAGVSNVTTNFVNNGVLDVLSGSMVFSGGFTNKGVIHGLVRQSGGITAIGAPVPSDFNGDNHADILLQNSNGQAAIWEMHGANVTGGGSVGANPGPTWKDIGTGDFNGDGLSDILLQSANGPIAIWEMNGTNLVGGGTVGLNPGPGWKAIGTGDFNGDDDSDIVLQNASTGQVAIWEMNGNKLIGGGAVSANPGPGWKAIGTGDFYGNGLSDILLQNASSGQVAIWEMNGLNVVGGGAVSSIPGPSWQAIGTADYSGDGHAADILLQNANGQAVIWEMSGKNLVGGGIVGANPGPSWHMIKPA